MLFPKYPHSALICGQTGCGKTEFVLNLLENEYKNYFEHIVIICPTLAWNEAYKNREWVWQDSEVYTCDSPKLHTAIKAFYDTFKGDETLFIIDDCAATKDLSYRKHKDSNCMISELAFSGRHAKQSCWILSQKYNSVMKDFREQTKWLCLFYCKDRDSYENCLKENDVITDKTTRSKINDILKTKKYSKLILKTDQPTSYKVL